jgi:hypothetical protein
MRLQNNSRLYASLALLLIPGLVHTQTYVAPRTEYGHPDLRGVWNFSSQTPFERPAQYANQEVLSAEEVQALIARRRTAAQASAEREATVSERLLASTDASTVGSVNSFWMDRDTLEETGRTSLIVHPANGRLPPVQPGVVVQHGDDTGDTIIPGTRPVRYTHGGIGRDGPEDRGLSERCLVFNSGPPLMSGPYNNLLQIFQNRDHVVLLAEMGFDARIIPLNKSTHVDPAITSWSGDARGYFDGDTLVVESRNFTDAIASLGLREDAYGTARNRLLIERFTPTAEGKLDYEFTIDDPDTFQDRIVARMPMTRIDAQLYEYACHAGNYAIRNILKGARMEEAANATP